MSKDPALIYIGGAGRSGSTLLERLLDAVEGSTGLGELVHLPTRSLGNDEPCSCGEGLTTCPLWSRIGETAFGGWDHLDSAEWQSLQHRVDRNRHIPRLAKPIGARFKADLSNHVERLEKIYRAAAEHSGAEVLVDSSKHSSTAYLLTHLDLNVTYVHLLRDPRGVAYSWTKSVTRPEATHSAMPQHSPARSAAWWDAFNLMMESLRANGAKVMTLRYEDLIDDPRRHLKAIIETAGPKLHDGWDDFLTAEGAKLSSMHSIAGNPMRFKQGLIQLNRDDDWRSGLDQRSQRVVSTITAPLRFRYGYRGSA